MGRTTYHAAKLMAVKAGTSFHPAHLPCWPTCTNLPACLIGLPTLFVPATGALELN